MSVMQTRLGMCGCRLAKKLSHTDASILSRLIKVNTKTVQHCNELKQKKPRASLQSHCVANTLFRHCNIYHDAKMFRQRLGASEYTVYGASVCVHISSLQAQTCIGWLHGAEYFAVVHPGAV